MIFQALGTNIKDVAFTDIPFRGGALINDYGNPKVSHTDQFCGENKGRHCESE